MGCRILRSLLLALISWPLALHATPESDRLSLLNEPQTAPIPQLRAQSVKDSEHFPFPADVTILPVGDSLHSEADRLNSTMGTCACSIDPFSRKANHGPIGQVSFKDPTGKRFTVSVVGYEFALKVLKVMSRGFGKNESLDGCYARAHRMAYILEKHGILTGKIIAQGNFRLRDKRTARGWAAWRYHLAPIIAINDGAKVSAWVLDPALFNEPVPVNAWLGLLLQQRGSSLKETYFTSRFVYHPSRLAQNIDNWDQADLKDAKRTLQQINRISRIRHSKGLVRLELAGLELALPDGFKPHEAAPRTEIRTFDISEDDIRSGHASPETSVPPLASSQRKAPDFQRAQSTPNL